MNISVIIPTYNEEEFITKTIWAIKKRALDESRLQIIVADGGSRDHTVDKAEEYGATVIHVPKKRRSVQLNEGAKAATGLILYFLHADTLPPRHFDRQIIKSVDQQNKAGCFRLSFDQEHILLRFYAWCTQFNLNAFRYGDQSLFIQSDNFESIGGFREELQYFEDHDIVERIKKEGDAFTILNSRVVTSSRRYLKNGIAKLQAVFILMYVLYKLGVGQPFLDWLYQKFIH